MLPVVRWQIIADFLVLTVAFYALLRWARSARAMRIALGIVGLYALALLARRLDLVVTSWVLDASAILAILVLLLIFQPELRRAFMRLDSTLKHWPRPEVVGIQSSRAIANAAFGLARCHVGALLVITRRDSISELLEGGMAIGAIISSELLEAIFQKLSPLHDGAAIIEGDRLIRANTVLPLTQRRDVPTFYGTRHRAAIGLAERCDALVIAVSEERAEVTLMGDGKIRHMENPEQFAATLEGLLSPARESIGARLHRFFFANLRPQVRRDRSRRRNLGDVVSCFWYNHPNSQCANRIRQCALRDGSHQPFRRHARDPGPGKSLDYGFCQPGQACRPI